MNETLQQILVAAAVIAAALHLLLRGRGKKGGKGGCGCVSAKPPAGEPQRPAGRSGGQAPR